MAASTQTQVRQLPPGITPPLVLEYPASSIPVIGDLFADFANASFALRATDAEIDVVPCATALWLRTLEPAARRPRGCAASSR